MRIVLQLPEVERQKEARPKRCPQCKGETFQCWGTEARRIKDTKVRTVLVRRYRCTSCRRTFRDYPKGVGPSQQSERLMKLCVIMWSLGLSYRGLALILSAFGINLSHMSGWRDVRDEGQAIRRRVKWKGARAVGVDGAWVNGTGIMVAVDLGNGVLLSIAEIDEKETAKVAAWLRTLKQRHNIGAIVSDDLAIYKEIADDLELGHQICQFHVRRWVGRRLKQLEAQVPEEWQEVIDEVRQLIAELPKNGGTVLHAIWKRMPGRTTSPDQERTPLELLRDLVLRLSRDWQRYIEFYSDAEVPWTNNQTERIIGKLKNRAKRVRGYKTSAGRLTGCLIATQSWT